MQPHMDVHDPPTVFGATFALSSCAGLAQLLRSGKKLTWRAVVSAMLNSAMFGLIIALTWWERYSVEPSGAWFLMGVSVMAGLGGVTLVDFGIELLKGKGKISIRIDRDEK